MKTKNDPNVLLTSDDPFELLTALIRDNKNSSREEIKREFRYLLFSEGYEEALERLICEWAELGEATK